MAEGEQKLWISWSLPPWGLRGGAKTTKINAIFQNLLLYSWTHSSQTVDETVFSIEPSTKIVKFMALGLGVQAVGWGQSWLCECSNCITLDHLLLHSQIPRRLYVLWFYWAMSSWPKLINLWPLASLRVWVLRVGLAATNLCVLKMWFKELSYVSKLWFESNKNVGMNKISLNIVECITLGLGSWPQGWG